MGAKIRSSGLLLHIIYLIWPTADPIQFGVPRVNGSRGQLNGSVNYDINENINVGVEGINILQTDADQFCVNNNSLLCFNGITDRRIVAGVNFKF